MSAPNFEGFPSIRRLFRDCIITEKLDGTNAQVFISEDGEVRAGSRNRWLTPGKQTDNFGFAAWVEEHREELLELGPGRHYGEWWGRGIQRGYGLDHKRFSLFNTSRWSDPKVRPPCCDVVPVLYSGPFSTTTARGALEMLRAHGSEASPGFMNPEGIVVFHTHSRTLFKATLGGDGHKGAS